MAKYELKKQAQSLRNKGLSLKEVCIELGISKSTASIWCRDIELTDKQKDGISKRAEIKTYKGALLGALANKEKARLIKEKEEKIAKSFISNLSAREICLVGATLYWAEGNKTGKSFGIVNSDFLIILMVMKWLSIQFNLNIENYIPRLFINYDFKNEEIRIKRYWSKLTMVSI